MAAAFELSHPRHVKTLGLVCMSEVMSDGVLGAERGHGRGYSGSGHARGYSDSGHAVS